MLLLINRMLIHQGCFGLSTEGADEQAYDKCRYESPQEV